MSARALLYESETARIAIEQPDGRPPRLVVTYTDNAPVFAGQSLVYSAWDSTPTGLKSTALVMGLLERNGDKLNEAEKELAWRFIRLGM